MSNKGKYATFEKLSNEIRPEIINLYNDYKYLNLNEKNFILLCEDLLSNIYNENGQIKDIVGYLDILKKCLNEYIITKHIQAEVRVSKAYEENIKTIKELESFLISNNMEVTPELCEQLLKNDTITRIIRKIITNNVDRIKEEGLEWIANSNNITLLLEMYCEKNSIPFKNGINIIIDDVESNSTNSLGLYLTQIPKSLLTREEEQRLFELKEQGDETAVEKIAEHNLLLVVSIANSYIGRGLDILDLIQEGNIGLMTAINKFDYRKGYKLSTYATWWIKQSIQRSIMNNSRLIRLPVHICEKSIRYIEATRKLEKELNRMPTKPEICLEMNITYEQLLDLEKATQSIVSMNAAVGDEFNSDTELGDLLASDDDTMEEQYLKSILPEEVKCVLERINLSDKEKFILLQRFGFGDNKPKTLEEIAKMMGITRERVRQIEAKAIRRIRMSPHIKRLAWLADIPAEDNMHLRRYAKSRH